MGLEDVDDILSYLVFAFVFFGLCRLGRLDPAFLLVSWYSRPYRVFRSIVATVVDVIVVVLSVFMVVVLDVIEVSTFFCAILAIVLVVIVVLAMYRQCLRVWRVVTVMV